MTREDSSRAQWGPMTSESLGCASCLSAQAAIMGAKFSCCTNLHHCRQICEHLCMRECILGIVLSSWCRSPNRETKQDDLTVS